MGRRILTIALGLLSIAPLYAQGENRFAFEIGGGVTTPLNPTAKYVGLSGNLVIGGGYNIDKHSAILGEFMWAGLPPSLSVLQPVDAPYGEGNLFSLTAEYRYRFDRIRGSPFGLYAIGGGGWYYRDMSIDKNYVAPSYTPCQQIYTWWGYACGPGGYVYTATLASKGVSAGGLNGGVGFTMRLTDSGLSFYVESRYHYAFSRIPSTVVPVTFGFRFN